MLLTGPPLKRAGPMLPAVVLLVGIECISNELEKEGAEVCGCKFTYRGGRKISVLA